MQREEDYDDVGCMLDVCVDMGCRSWSMHAHPKWSYPEYQMFTMGKIYRISIA